MTESKQIEARIADIGPGRAFAASDFSEVASARIAGNVLGRMHARGKISRAVRGVYYVPEHSDLLGIDVAVGAKEVVDAIARANKWVVCPAGDAALNDLGLDTQVPANIRYVSSGPYKRYSYGGRDIELRHRANRDLLDRSRTTCLFVQALKALGKDNVDDQVVATLARNLSGEQVDTLVMESSGITSWVAEMAKKVQEAKHGENR